MPLQISHNNIVGNFTLLFRAYRAASSNGVGRGRAQKPRIRWPLRSPRPPPPSVTPSTASIQLHRRSSKTLDPSTPTRTTTVSLRARPSRDIPNPKLPPIRSSPPPRAIPPQLLLFLRHRLHRHHHRFRSVRGGPGELPRRGGMGRGGLINGRRGGAASHRRGPFLHRWISIALSTVLLRCGMFTIAMLVRKRLYGMRQELFQYLKLVKDSKGKKSIQELADAGDPLVRNLGFLPILQFIATPYTFVTLYSAISNMVEKVPSLKGGGALWFTDLTTPDALCIFPMITSLFIMLRFEVNYGVAAKRTEHSRKMEDNARQVVRAMSLLPMLWTATLPQAISCSLVTWSGLTLAGRIVLKHPDVQKVLYGGSFLLKQECSSSNGQKGPTAEDSPPPVKEEEEPVSPETKKSSDASVHIDESDKKSTKDG
ncbi:mitochondrial inner membrane protein OXA1-like isoform X1 [Triticum aestivum]|uniref:mitochondrial inner membrane protein OXA1-like isoform X1 n=1 Tax=Triticum aestivum TaxID=4565 RepID=UPI001D02E0E0|nr:mitochondrial inner membrane protein OXA1-like isoform X1 [Triticum aestivum]